MSISSGSVGTALVLNAFYILIFTAILFTSSLVIMGMSNPILAAEASKRKAGLLGNRLSMTLCPSNEKGKKHVVTYQAWSCIFCAGLSPFPNKAVHWVLLVLVDIFPKFSAYSFIFFPLLGQTWRVGAPNRVHFPRWRLQSFQASFMRLFYPIRRLEGRFIGGRLANLSHASFGIFDTVNRFASGGFVR